MTTTFSNPPLISVIITCYNHGRYLADAIRSVQQQPYNPVEIIVVDDGSTDNTKAVVRRFGTVKYVYQKNAGLAAARNTGIDYSTGSYLLFLDADDWLLENALGINLAHLAPRVDFAFVSGGHIKVDKNKKLIGQVGTTITTDPYQALLRQNYIGMHAAVLYRRWAFDNLRFDVTLNACEDYDVYLKIARQHPVTHHTTPVAAYRIHHQNMSGNLSRMLDAVMQVLQRQQPLVKNKTEAACLQEGFKIWTGYYTNQIYYDLLFNNVEQSRTDQAAATLKNYNPVLYKIYIEECEALTMLRNGTQNKKPERGLKKYIPDGVLRRYRKLQGRPTRPPFGQVDLGDLNRTTPFSTDFGFDRGGAVDRYYIENFLQRQAHFIKGHVLEVQDDAYTQRFGGAAVTQSDVLHISKDNPKATLVADLSNAPQLQDETFDCIILTQTLHFIYHHKEALQTCYRILKPGATLLLTVPGITSIDHSEWKKSWLWAYTDTVINRMLAEIFGADHVFVETFGNVLSATAFLYGMGLPELKPAQLDKTDPHYQVIIAARVHKPVKP